MKDLFDQNGRRVAWLLTELEHQTENRLSDETRHELIAEVSAHLDSAIRARLELGMAPIDAEREAVELFGHPKTYVDELLAIHESAETAPTRPWQWVRGDRATLASFWGAMLFVSSFLLSQGAILSHESACLVLLAFACLLAFFSFRARRIQLFPIALAAMGGYVTLVLAITLSWTTFVANDYPYGVPKWKASEVLAQDRSILEEIKQPMAKLQHGLSLHVGKVSSRKIAGMSPADKALFFSSPTLTSKSLSMYGELSRAQPEISQILYVPASNGEEASGIWRTTGKQAYSELKRSQAECNLQISGILGTQNQSGAKNFLQNIWSYRTALPLFLTFGLLVNALAGGLGWIIAFPGRRRSEARAKASL
jgi:hypothetical protein